jgi:putative PIN family toxin of toxin-antitoxin system
MKVFLDTNVLVSATATRGLCADVLRAVLTSHQLGVSEPLFTELERVLLKKFGVPGNLVAELLETLKQDAHYSSPTSLPNIEIRDKDDVPILSSAVNGEADIFVTGDEELLKLGEVEKLEIISPRIFWERLKAESEDVPGDE